jgi:hypothetical protein
LSTKRDAKKSAVVWLRPDQLPLAHQLVESCDLNLEAAGSSIRGRSTELAAALHTEPADDLRAALAETSASLVLLLDPGDFGAKPSITDDRALAAAKSRGVKVASLEPIPATALALHTPGVGDPAEDVAIPDPVRFLPHLRQSKRHREAAEIIEQFGYVRTLTIEQWNTPAEGSLGSLLFSALDLAIGVLGVPESVDAQFVSPAHGQGVHTVAGDSLRALSGDLTALMRFSDGRGATIVASDHAGRWNRVVTMLGPSGRLRIYDDGFELVNAAGEKVDESRQRRTTKSPAHSVTALADAIDRLLDPHAAVPPPLDHLGILTTAQATLLSTRTGQPESPETIRRMVQRG